MKQTELGARRSRQPSTFSILERIELGETGGVIRAQHEVGFLSVSSNGSNWVKLTGSGKPVTRKRAFSILERIELGETPGLWAMLSGVVSFSILERIELGETSKSRRAASISALSVSSNGSNWVKHLCSAVRAFVVAVLSVSSNGSNWVKQAGPRAAETAARRFQSPRTDRIG